MGAAKSLPCSCGLSCSGKDEVTGARRIDEKVDIAIFWDVEFPLPGLGASEGAGVADIGSIITENLDMQRAEADFRERWRAAMAPSAHHLRAWLYAESEGSGFDTTLPEGCTVAWVHFARALRNSAPRPPAKMPRSHKAALGSLAGEEPHVVVQDLCTKDQLQLLQQREAKGPEWMSPEHVMQRALKKKVFPGFLRDGINFKEPGEPAQPAKWCILTTNPVSQNVGRQSSATQKNSVLKTGASDSNAAGNLTCLRSQWWKALLRQMTQRDLHLDSDLSFDDASRLVKHMCEGQGTMPFSEEQLRVFFDAVAARRTTATITFDNFFELVFAGDKLPVWLNAWQWTLMDLACRGFELGALLDFYSLLGNRLMKHFDPTKSTTNDVVRLAIIPMTAERCCALAILLQKGRPTTPSKIVTHNWGNLFCDSVAAIIADALEVMSYESIAVKLRTWDMRRIKCMIGERNLRKTYWFCAVSVNQHRTLCDSSPPWAVDSVTGSTFPVCKCAEAKFQEGNECEANKFDEMMSELHERRCNFGQVIAVDRRFELFTRAWAVSEMATADERMMNQAVKIPSFKNVLQNIVELRSLDMRNCKASRPEDKARIFGRIGDFDKFNKNIRRLMLGDAEGGQHASGLIGMQLEDMKHQQRQHLRTILSLIRKSHIVEVKSQAKSVDVLQFVFDTLHILMRRDLTHVRPAKKSIAGIEAIFIESSWPQCCRSINKTDFVIDLIAFFENELHTINDETSELLEPYLRYNEDPKKHWGPFPFAVVEEGRAQHASIPAGQFCALVSCALEYHEASNTINMINKQRSKLVAL